MSNPSSLTTAIDDLEEEIRLASYDLFAPVSFATVDGDEGDESDENDEGDEND